MITGGHMTPALAVMEELESRGYRNFVWVGHEFAQGTSRNKSAEYKIITEKKIPFYALTAGKLMLWITPQNFHIVIRDWFRTPLGFIQARSILRRERPDVVVSFGGYLALPVVWQARRMKIPVITHEQTVTSGRANKMIAKWADLVLTSWESTLNRLPAEKTVLTGNPIRKSVFEQRTDNYNFPDNGLPVLYITGGNQGSYNMSRRIFAVLPELLEEFNIIHQTGDSSERETYAKALFCRDRLPFELRARYIPKPFIYEDEIGEVFSKTDILFGRSGANTVSEVAALGKLSVFMPIKWSSGGEQKKNAEMLEETGLAKMCWQTDDPNEPQRVLEYLLLAKECLTKNIGFDERPLNQCQEDARKLIKLDASQLISDQIEKLVSA